MATTKKVAAKKEAVELTPLKGQTVSMVKYDLGFDMDCGEDLVALHKEGSIYIGSESSIDSMVEEHYSSFDGVQLEGRDELAALIFALRRLELAIGGTP
jgi:hypothetical protein